MTLIPLRTDPADEGAFRTRHGVGMALEVPRD